MSWVRLDDGFADHPKILAVGPMAAMFHVRGLCYAARQMTDGFVPDAQAHAFASQCAGGIANGQADAQALASPVLQHCDCLALLIGQELWEKSPGGYRIHDYLKYNPSRRHVMQQRKKKAMAGRKGGQANRKAHAQARASRLLQEESSPPSPPRSVSRRDTTPRAHMASRNGHQGDGFDEFWQAWPAARRQAKADAHLAWAALHPDPLLRQTILAAVTAQKQADDWTRDGGRFIPHAHRWLKKRRWEDVAPAPARNPYAGFPTEVP